MKRSIILLICFFSCFVQVSMAQNKKIVDSLLILYKNAKKDTTKIKLSLQIAEQYLYTGKDTIWIILQKALETSKSIRYEYGNIRSLFLLTVENKNRGWFEKALPYYKEMQTFNLAPKDKSSLFYNMGRTYQSLGDYQNAVNHYYQSLKIKENIQDKVGIANIYSRLADIDVFNRLYKEARKKRENALLLYRETKKKEQEGFSLSDIGNTYEAEGNLDIALEYYIQSKNIFKELREIESEAGTSITIANIYQKKGNNKEAEKLYREVLKIDSSFFYAHLGLGALLAKEQQYQESILYLQKALTLTRNPIEIRDAQKILYETYKAQGNNVEALKYFEQTKQIEDSLFTIDKSKAIANLTSTIELERKEKELIIERKEKEYKERELQIAQKQAEADKLFALAKAETNKRKADSLLNLAQKTQLEADNLRIKDQKIQAENKAKSLALEQEKRAKAFQTQLNYFLLALLLCLIVLLYLVYKFEEKQRKSNRLLAAKNVEINQQKEEISIQAENLQLAYNQLQELEHFKESMLGMIVHDLKNPLNAILHQEEDRKSRTYHIANQMMDLVMNILDIQKFSHTKLDLQLQSCNLLNITELAVQQVGFLITDKNIQFQNQIPQNVTVNADKELIIRLITNLLTNAIKFTPAGKKISLYIEIVSPTQLKYCVQDTGEGIPADKQASIFEPFEQAKAQDSGKAKSTGLGLSFCKMVAEAHPSGKISVESEVGKGTTFYFLLPVVEQDLNVILPETQDFTYNKTQPLSEAEIEIIQNYIAKIQKLAIFETSDIIEALATMPESSPACVWQWKTQVENAVFNYDEVTFNQLKNL